MGLALCASDRCVAPSNAQKRLHGRIAALLAAIAIFTASAVSAHAQTNWTGAVSSDWFNGWQLDRRCSDGCDQRKHRHCDAEFDGDQGPGARAQNLTIGQNGTGMLTIQTGGTLTDSFGAVGNLPGSQGTVTVTGAGSNWTNAGTVVVGGLGTGTLTIQERRHGEQWRRRLRRIGCRLDWYGDGDRPGLHLEQRSRRRAQYRQFWHGHTHDRERWDGHQYHHLHRQHRQGCRLAWVR